MRAMMVIGLMFVAGPLMAQPAPVRRPENEQIFQRRYQITLMENVLSSAVRHAAETMGRRMQAVAPDLVLMTGTARARGFFLPDYGVFFDVEAPAMQMSVAWTLRVMERDLTMERSLQVLREQLGSLPAAERPDVEQALRRIELAVGPADAARQPPSPAGVRPGMVGAAVVDPQVEARPEARAAAPAQTGNLNEDYTEVVKNALIDAMLDFSGPIAIAADEWLVVAARDAYGPVGPGEIYDAMTVVLRVKGSDLAAFRADRITRDEARKRVEVREF